MAYPRQVQIMVTERCNLRCRHCAVPAEDSPADHELSPKQWLGFIRQIAEAGVECLTLSGGEAMLRPETIRLAVSAHEQGIGRTTIVTNGTLLRGPAIAALADAQARFDALGLHVSLDGASPETHDWMRGRGTFKRILENLVTLRGTGARVTGVHTVLHLGNYHEFGATADLVQRLGASVWTLFPIASLGRAMSMRFERLSLRQWEEMLARAQGLWADRGLEVAVMGPIYGEDWPADEGGTVPSPKQPSSRTCCVGPDGAVFTCPPLRHRPVANVTDIEDAAAFDRAMLAAATIVEETCPTCKFLPLCVGVQLDGSRQPVGTGFGTPR